MHLQKKKILRVNKSCKKIKTKNKQVIRKEKKIKNILKRTRFELAHLTILEITTY